MHPHFPLHFTAQAPTRHSPDVTRTFSPTCRNRCSGGDLAAICRAMMLLDCIVNAELIEETGINKIRITVADQHVWDDPSCYPHQRLEEFAEVFEGTHGVQLQLEFPVAA